MKKKIVFILILILLINFSIPTTKYSTKSNIVENKIKYSKKKSKKSFSKKVNSTATCPDFDITIKKYAVKKKGARIDSFRKVGSPELVAIYVTVKNTSKKTKTFYTTDIELINTNKEILSPDIFSYTMWGKYKMFDSPKLQSGGKSTGYIQYTNSTQKNSNMKVKINCNNGGLFKKDKIVYVNLS